MVATMRLLDMQSKKTSGGNQTFSGLAIKKIAWQSPNKASSSHQTFFGQASKEIA
jgi:hypothetical protein